MVITIPHSCPVCRGKTSGDEKNGFFCKHCKLIIRKRDLKIPHHKIKKRLKPSKHKSRLRDF